MSVFSNWLGVTPIAGVFYAPTAWAATREETRWLIRSDLYRYFGRTGWRAALYAFMRIPGFRFTLFLRKATYHSARTGVFHRLAFWIHWLILQHCGFKYGFQIPYTTRVGAGLLIYHHGTLLVNAQAVLGDNVNLSPGVVIGQSNRGKHAGAPVIGNRVWIGCNAVIVGAVTIGDDAMIAPGAYVNFDVPAKAVVIGNPGQITSYAGSESYTANLALETPLTR